jgi:four helix bundle protein
MQDIRRLKVWERAHQLSLAVYSNTTSFPHDERYGLTSQIRRAAVSIPANLAEGCGRGGDADFTGLFKLQWALRVSSNITCCSRVT